MTTLFFFFYTVGKIRTKDVTYNARNFSCKRIASTKERKTYCIDRGQREREVEVVAVVDVPVPHELEILVPHHLLEETKPRGDANHVNKMGH